MDELLQNMRDYLDQAAGLAVKPIPWPGAAHLPPFLQDRYDYHQVVLHGMPCLLMLDRHEYDETPATVRKHIDQIQQRWGNPTVLVRRAMTAYNRKRLVEQRVPFIVPDNQMYLLPLGIDFREHYRKVLDKRSRFRPASQATLIHLLLSDDEHFRLAELAATLGYSTMTLSRALDELETAQLVKTSVHGRERHVHLIDPRSVLWKRAQPFLASPVQRRHWVLPFHRPELSGPCAGLSALAAYSDLAEPDNAVIALSRDDWNQSQKQGTLHKVEAADHDGKQIEIWAYPPTLFACDGLVDRLSLYLSLRKTVDERIEAALETMMGDMRW